MKSFLYLLSGTALLAYSITANGLNLPNNVIPTSPKPTSPKPTMDSSQPLKSVSLQAREEEFSPLGQPPKADRPISFATVFLSFENPIERDQTLQIDRIDIIDRHSQTSILNSSAAQTLTLRPLEHSIIDIHLQSRQNYGKSSQLQAIVRYHIAGQTNSLTMQSLPVTIER